MATKEVAEQSKSDTVIDETDLKTTIDESSESLKQIKLSEYKDIRRLDVNWPPKELVEYDQQAVTSCDKDELSKAVCKIETSGFPLMVWSFHDDERKVRRYCNDLQRIFNISSDFIEYKALHSNVFSPGHLDFVFLSKNHESWIESQDAFKPFVRCFLLDKFEKQPLHLLRSLDISDTEAELIPYVIAKEIVSAAKRIGEEKRIRKEGLLNCSLEHITLVAVDTDLQVVSLCGSVLHSIEKIQCQTVSSIEEMGELEISHKSTICLWFLEQKCLQNEQLIDEIKRINLTAPILPIILQKCDIPEHLTEMEFLDVSESKAEDVPITVVLALRQYDHLKLQWIMQRFEDEPDLKQIMQADKVFGPVYSDLLTTGGRNSVDRLTYHIDWIGKLRVCLKYTYEDDRILNDVLISLRKKRKLFFPIAQIESYTMEEYLHYCIMKNDQIGILEWLQNQTYLYKSQLREIVETFGRKHPLTKLVYKRICKRIKEHNSMVVDVWPAYKMKAKGTNVREEDIRIVVEFEEELGPLCIHNYQVETIKRLQKKKEQKSEHKDVIDYAYERKIRLSGKDISQIGKVINKEISRLRQQHRNLVMIAASPIKSIGYTTENHEMKEAKCVVLFVRAKGLIPLHEDCFPENLGDFQIDVREGDCELAVGGGPHIRHVDLKMGCEIGAFGINGYGTLGGFGNTKENGMCALTCCHVTSTQSELQNFSRRINYNGVTRDCQQPHEHNHDNVFGYTVNNFYNAEIGVDATLIKIKTRFPTSGFFPDCTLEELELAGIAANELVYTSGRIEIIDETTFDEAQDMILIKYGATSSLTRGRLAAFDMPTWIPEVSLTFRHQIEINDIKGHGEFAKGGDSGSFVFLSTENGLVAIGMIMSVTGHGVTYVNPINNVLDALDCTLNRMEETE